MFFVLLKKYSLDKKFNIICLNVLNFFFFFNGKKSFLLSGRSLTPPPSRLVTRPLTLFLADSLTGELKYEIVLAFYHVWIYVQNSQIVFYKTYNRLRILSWQRVVSNFDWRWVRPFFGDFFHQKSIKNKRFNLLLSPKQNRYTIIYISDWISVLNVGLKWLPRLQIRLLRTSVCRKTAANKCIIPLPPHPLNRLSIRLPSLPSFKSFPFAIFNPPPLLPPYYIYLLNFSFFLMNNILGYIFTSENTSYFI